jgi:hypothetical protein
MEVIVLILVGLVTVGGLYRIVWDEICQSRRVDRVTQAPSNAIGDAELPSSQFDGTDRELDSARRHAIIDADSRQGSSSAS